MTAPTKPENYTYRRVGIVVASILGMYLVDLIFSHLGALAAIRPQAEAVAGYFGGILVRHYWGS